MNRVTKFAVVVTAAVALIGVSKTFAMTEVWSAQATTFLTLSDSVTPVAQGDLVEIGLLTNSAALATAGTTSAASFNSCFKIWDSTTIGTGTGAEGSWTYQDIEPGAGFFSQQFCILGFDSTTVAGAPEWGAFTDTTWVFPASEGAAANSADIGDTGVTALVGSLSSGTVLDPNLGGPGVNAAALFAPVPEPSTLVLVGLGLLGAVGLVRRHR